MRTIQTIGTIIMAIGFIVGVYGIYQFQTAAFNAQSSEDVMALVFSTLAPGMVTTLIGSQLVAWDRHQVEIKVWHESSQYLAIRDHLKPIKHWYSFLSNKSRKEATA